MLHMSVVHIADVITILLAASCPSITSDTSSTSEAKYLTPPVFEAASFREAVRNMWMLYLAKILSFPEDRSRLLLWSLDISWCEAIESGDSVLQAHVPKRCTSQGSSEIHMFFPNLALGCTMCAVFSLHVCETFHSQ